MLIMKVIEKSSKKIYKIHFFLLIIKLRDKILVCFGTIEIYDFCYSIEIVV